MLRPHQRHVRPERRGKRTRGRAHQNHPVRELKRAVEKEVAKAKRRPPPRKHRGP